MANDNIWFTIILIMIGVSVFFFYLHSKIQLKKEQAASKKERYSPLMDVLDKFSFRYGIAHSLFITIMPMVFTGDLVLANARGLFIVYFLIHILLAGFIITLMFLDEAVVKIPQAASDMMKEARNR